MESNGTFGLSEHEFNKDYPNHFIQINNIYFKLKLCVNDMTINDDELNIIKMYMCTNGFLGLDINWIYTNILDNDEYIDDINYYKRGIDFYNKMNNYNK